MAANELIHPSMLAGLERFYQSTVTFQTRTEVNTDGSPVHTWADTLDLIDLPCRIAPAQSPRDKQEAVDLSALKESHRINVIGIYTEITASMRAVVTHKSGEMLTLDVVAAEHDSEGKTTRVRAKQIVT